MGNGKGIELGQYHSNLRPLCTLELGCKGIEGREEEEKGQKWKKKNGLRSRNEMEKSSGEEKKGGREEDVVSRIGSHLLPYWREMVFGFTGCGWCLVSQGVSGSGAAVGG